jgi:2-oxoglutarate ferredoxin oxidoreductase subunit beta
MTDTARYSRLDFQSDQEVRWCPGCGDYTILSSVQKYLSGLDVDKENHVFVSGIGCAARFPYYMNTYGMHSIHGRATAIGAGLAVANPELTVWIVTGDGDALSIGGNHLIHAMRRNANLNILLFNNQIYGLTKGQYSPTSEVGKMTKTSPMGSIDRPFNPASLALGAGATFVARTIDMDVKHTTAMLDAAYHHDGTSFLEIYQNCNVFNDKAFVELTGREQRDLNRINLEPGKPVVFGPNDMYGVMLTADGARVVEVAQYGLENIHVHDPTKDDPSAAFALSHLSLGPTGPTPVGVLRSVDRATYGAEVERQVTEATAAQGEGDLAELLTSIGTWEAS